MSERLQRIRRTAALELSHRLIGSRQGDRYVVASPRSGSTWLRTMLTALIHPDVRVTPPLFNATIPSVSIRTVSRIRQLPDPRTIMTHAGWRPEVKRAVYVVRDGRDSLVSRFHYEITRQGLQDQVDFRAFFDRYERGVYGQTWHDNVESWLSEGKATLGAQLLVVRFEDLKADTPHHLQRIAAHLGIPSDDARAVRAVEDASISRMRRLEKQKSGDVVNPNASFYRGGKTGGWRDYLQGDLQDRFQRLASRAMGMAGYEV